MIIEFHLENIIAVFVSSVLATVFQWLWFGWLSSKWHLNEGVHSSVRTVVEKKLFVLFLLNYIVGYALTYAAGYFYAHSVDSMFLVGLRFIAGFILPFSLINMVLAQRKLPSVLVGFGCYAITIMIHGFFIALVR